MSLPRLKWWVVLAFVAVLGCDGSENSKSAGLPSGFDRVNNAFGIRTLALKSDAGVHTAPVVEFQNDGGYALYPFFANCQGAFGRGQGTAFAADGTVREQLDAITNGDLSAYPQYQPVADRMCAQAKAALDALKEGDGLRKTRFGVLRTQMVDSSAQLVFEKVAVEQGGRYRLIRAIATGAADVVLVNDATNAATCEGGEYFFVVAKSSTDVTTTQRFSTCRTGDPDLIVLGASLDVVFPGLRNGVPVKFSYQDGVVIAPQGADGQQNEGSFGMDDPLAAGDDAPYADGDEATGEPPSGEDRQRLGWLEICTADNRQVSTPAGSQVRLNESEARAYCGCLDSSVPDEIAEALRSGQRSPTADSATWIAAQATCINRLL